VKPGALSKSKMRDIKADISNSIKENLISQGLEYIKSDEEKMQQEDIQNE